MWGPHLCCLEELRPVRSYPGQLVADLLPLHEAKSTGDLRPLKLDGCRWMMLSRSGCVRPVDNTVARTSAWTEEMINPA